MKLRSINKRSKKAGLSPGTLVHIGEKRLEKPKITVIDYDEQQFQAKEVKTIEECLPLKDKPTVTWINIDGIHEIEIIAKTEELFGFHPLILEDIVNSAQRPKMEDFESYIFVVLKMLHYEDKNREISTEQISLILGPNFVISFQEREEDVFDPVRKRIKNAKGHMRKMGADYLAYCLIDAIVDNYFLILEKMGDRFEALEAELVANPALATLQEIQNLKRDMITLRRSIWPLREVISGLERGESLLIKNTTRTYLRDVYDHTIQIIDAIESFRDMLSGMFDIYLSSISNKMNEIMKVLTIIATLFIPLTFIAGIYGMNFKYMPELEWRGGYFIILLVMGIIGIGMLIYFKRKKWL